MRVQTVSSYISPSSSSHLHQHQHSHQHAKPSVVKVSLHPHTSSSFPFDRTSAVCHRHRVHSDEVDVNDDVQNGDEGATTATFLKTSVHKSSSSSSSSNVSHQVSTPLLLSPLHKHQDGYHQSHDDNNLSVSVAYATSRNRAYSIFSRVRAHLSFPWLSLRNFNLQSTFSSFRTATSFPSAFARIFLTICVVFLIIWHVTSRYSEYFINLFSFHDLHSSWVSLRRSGRRWLHKYQRLLHVYPLLSRSITAAIIYFAADTIAQLLNGQNHGKDDNTSRTRIRFSMKRVIRYSFYGLVINGPFLYMWYDGMHRFGPPDDLHGAIIKAVFESLTLEPICILMYIVYDTILARKSWRHLTDTVRGKFLPIWLANTIYWLPANFANYYAGTPDMRVIFANTCSLFWNVYFSDRVNKWKSYMKPWAPQEEGQKTQRHGYGAEEGKNGEEEKDDAETEQIATGTTTAIAHDVKEVNVGRHVPLKNTVKRVS